MISIILNLNIENIRNNKILVEKSHIRKNINCPVCNYSKYKVIVNKIEICEPAVICKNCGLVYLNPRHNIEWYHELYKLDQRKKQLLEYRPDINHYAQKQKLKGKSIHNYLLNENPQFSLKEKSIFEVGCTSGGILKYFKEMGASKVEGIDLEEDYVAFGKKLFSINIQVASINDYHTDEKYDLIILRHVLEHLVNPIESLKIIQNMLSENGIIYVEVPSLFSMGIKKNLYVNFIIDHPIIYSPITLVQTLERSGFKIVSSNKNVNRTHLRVLAKKDKTSNNLNNIITENYLKVYLLSFIYHYTTFLRKLYYNTKSN